MQLHEKLLLRLFAKQKKNAKNTIFNIWLVAIFLSILHRSAIY